MYLQAKDFYLGEFSDETKAVFYVDILRKGMMPNAPDEKAKKEEKEAYEDLMQVKKEVDAMDALELAVGKGDMEKAKRIANQHMGVEDLGILNILSGYGAPLFRDAEKSIYIDVVNERRSIVAESLKDGKLYGLIDKGINKHEQGKAYSLAGMYKAYKIQQEINKAKEADRRGKK